MLRPALFVVFAWQSALSISKLLDGRVGTVVTRTAQDSIVFPSVSMCVRPRLGIAAVNDRDLYTQYAEQMATLNPVVKVATMAPGRQPEDLKIAKM